MLSKGSILVVDDEVNLCRILGAKLSKNGYSVVAVHDGVQAVEQVKEGAFDVVLLDLILPKKDGLTVLGEIRHLDERIPVIVMTACEGSETVEQAMSKGACAYVSKPFDLDSLVTLVDATSKSNCLNGESLDSSKQPQTSVLFSPGRPVQIEVYNGSTSGSYTSRIIDRLDRFLIVQALEKDGSILQIPSRTVVRVGLAAEEAFYSFSTSVANFREEDKTLVLEKPCVIYQTQRRQHKRHLANVGLRYKISTLDQTIDAQCKDYSLGGMSLITDRELRVGTELYVETDPIPEVGSIACKGHVVRVRKLENGGDHKFMVGVKFALVNQ